MKPKIAWSPDCSGKQDYDGNILSVTTRYWPAGGGYHIFDTSRAAEGLRPSNDGSPPSAKASIIIQHHRDGDGENYVVLAKQDF
jgi:hypothetical protein